jgi:hypothetical protein
MIERWLEVKEWSTTTKLEKAVLETVIFVSRHLLQEKALLLSTACATFVRTEDYLILLIVKLPQTHKPMTCYISEKLVKEHHSSTSAIIFFVSHQEVLKFVRRNF